MGHLKGQCSLLINFILKKEKVKRKKGNSIGHLGWHLVKTKSPMHALALKFSRRVGGFNAPHLFKPHFSFISRKGKKKRKNKNRKLEEEKSLLLKRKNYIYIASWVVFWEWNWVLLSSLFCHHLFRYISFLTLCNVTSKIMKHVYIFDLIIVFSLFELVKYVMILEMIVFYY